MRCAAFSTSSSAKLPGFTRWPAACGSGSQRFSDSIRGDLSGRGITPSLALSGQHVACLSTVLLLGWRVIGPLLLSLSPSLWARLHACCCAFPLGAAVLLYVTSLGAPAMGRTLAMVLAVACLGWRRLGCSTLQLTGSAIACLLLWDPSWLGQKGFFSAACTLFLVGAIGDGSRYFRVAVAMSLFSLPLSAFFFGKAALASPLTNSSGFGLGGDSALWVCASFDCLPLPYPILAAAEGVAEFCAGTRQSGARRGVALCFGSEAGSR